MSVINISLNDFLCFMNDQDNPKNNNPRMINVFSLAFKLIESLKKKQYVKVRANINNGIIFEVINMKNRLYLEELNKYFIPTYVFNEKIDEICSVQQGVFVEKMLRVANKIKGKKTSIYLFSLL